MHVLILILLLLASCSCNPLRKPKEPDSPQIDEDSLIDEPEDSDSDDEEYEYAYALKNQSSDTRIFICKLKNGKKCNDEFVSFEGDSNE